MSSGVFDFFHGELRCFPKSLPNRYVIRTYEDVQACDLMCFLGVLVDCVGSDLG